MSRIVSLTMLLLVGLIVPSSIYALQREAPQATDPKEIALIYIRGSPTFRFDGMDATLKIIDFTILKTNPPKYLVTMSFSCLHSGYGDRAGKPTLQVITPHTAVITVVEGKVTSAIIDERWDELKQELLPVTRETIIKIALDWLRASPTFRFDGVEESLKVTEVWQALTFAYPSFWQVTIEFDCLQAGYGDRTGQFLAQVITHHIIRIHVTEGVITLAIIDEKWDELNQKPLSGMHTPEEAKQTALDWFYGCTTFKYDGIKDTVKVIKVDTLRMPNAYEIYINFVSAYPGYGDRGSNPPLGPSQQHTIRITVHEGLVTRAIIDDVWDEINQKMLPP